MPACTCCLHGPIGSMPYFLVSTLVDCGCVNSKLDARMVPVGMNFDAQRCFGLPGKLEILHVCQEQVLLLGYLIQMAQDSVARAMPMLQQLQRRFVTWNETGSVDFIFKVDGGSSEVNPDLARFGVVLRMGIGLGGCITGSIGGAGALNAELQGLIQGLSYVAELGIPNLCSYSDSAEAV